MKQHILTGAAALAMVFGVNAAQAGSNAPTNPGPVTTCPDDAETCDTPPDAPEDTGGGSSGGTTPGSGTTGSGSTPSAFSSGISVTTDRSAYVAAANAATDNFENIADSASGGIGEVAYQSGSYVDANGTTFSAPTRGSVINLNILDVSYVNGSNLVGTKFGSDVLTSNTEALTIHFSQAVNSFSIDYASLGRGFANQSDAITFAVGGLGSQTFTSNSSGLSFLGLTSDTAFDTVTISTGTANSSLYFDNVSFTPAATTSDVPEPASWAMMVGGFGLLGGALRRRKSAVTFA